MNAYRYARDTAPETRLGLIALQADQTIERDLRRLVPPQVTLLVSRVPCGTEVTRESLGEMSGHIAAAARLLPRGITCDAVGYGCTSGTAEIGTGEVARLIRQGVSARAVTQPVSALATACRALGVSRMAFLSPYVASVSENLRLTLARDGLATPVFGSFEEAEEAAVARIDAASIIAAATDLAAQGGTDALFLSCTNLRTLDVIAPLEERLGIPVLSSNQVLAWHMLGLAGARATPGPWGRLFAAA